jgi:hypothetical protein
MGEAEESIHGYLSLGLKVRERAASAPDRFTCVARSSTTLWKRMLTGTQSRSESGDEATSLCDEETSRCVRYT